MRIEEYKEGTTQTDNTNNTNNPEQRKVIAILKWEKVTE